MASCLRNHMFGNMIVRKTSEMWKWGHAKLSAVCLGYIVSLSPSAWGQMPNGWVLEREKEELHHVVNEWSAWQSSEPNGFKFDFIWGWNKALNGQSCKTKWSSIPSGLWRKMSLPLGPIRCQTCPFLSNRLFSYLLYLLYNNSYNQQGGVQN